MKKNTKILISGQKGPNMSTVTKLVASIFRSRAAKSPCLEPDRVARADVV